MPATAPRAAALLAAALLGPAGAADGPPATVYDPARVWPVHITLPAAEYAAMQPRGGGGFPGFGPPAPAPKTPIDPGREVHRNTFGVDLPWATGAVVLGDEAFPRVGVRYKGNGTILDAARTVKKSFKIDLDRAGGDGRFGGARSVNLHSGVTDPSGLRETFGYAVFRAAGVPAPGTALAEVRLTVPGKHAGELLGAYTLVQPVDKPFLRARFGTDAGLLMKPEGVRDFDDWGDDWGRYEKAYAPNRKATPAEAARVVAFCRLVHRADDAAFARDVGAFLDVDNYLRFLAATAFVANTDSLFTGGHNYCLYLHPGTNRLHVLPWDLDRAFANFPLFGSARRQMDLSLTHPYPGAHKLTDRLLAVPAVRDQYRRLLTELAATAFDPARLGRELGALEAAGKELFARSARAAAGRTDGPAGFGPPGLFGPPPDLKRFVERRAASVAAQLAGTAKGFVPAAGFGGGGPPKLGELMAGPMLDNLDADGDDRLSRAEWVGAARRVFAAAPQDRDGRADLKGLTAGLQKLLPAPRRGRPARRVRPGRLPRRPDPRPGRRRPGREGDGRRRGRGRRGGVRRGRPAEDRGAGRGRVRRPPDRRLPGPEVRPPAEEGVAGCGGRRVSGP